MLKLLDIKKEYKTAGESVQALKGVSLNFRKNEFVSILGASGCGKTTLLNIIGGLDKYTTGDLVINGKSTKKYSDRDWDTYRNHSIGFIFQSYHLIPHQTILQNVELALMIAGVSKEERRKRAVEALGRVGLGDKIHCKPNQLSGGQAQRVAIARALINDPEIVLADEPTGALDSKTSVQIMELLKEISKDRLVIMVTHNPELAEQYSTRIIRLLDGLVTDDSMPYDGEGEQTEDNAESVETVESAQTPQSEKKSKGKKKRSSMSFGMAFMLSLKNLLSKKGRTSLVSIAGSIGIIGVSMVLAISAGVQSYIKSMENDMLSGYPLTVAETSIDFEALMNFSSDKKVDISKLDDGKIYVDSLLKNLIGMSKSFVTNKIDENYISYIEDMPETYYNALQYGYRFNIANNIYTDFKVTDDLSKFDNGNENVSGNYSVTAIRQMYTSVLLKEPDYADYASMISTVGSFSEIPDNYDYILSQYDVLTSYNGKTEKLSEEELKDIFQSKDSLIMVVDDRQISDLALGQFGYMTQEQFLDYAYKALIDNDKDDKGHYDESLISDYLNGKEYDFFIGENAKTFTWYPNDTVYSEAYGEQFEIGEGYSIPAVYKYNPSSENFSKEGAVDLKVKVILQKKSNISYGCLSTGIYYTNALTEHMLETSMSSRIVEYINENGSLYFLPYNYDFNYVDGNAFKLENATGYIYQTDTSMMSMITGGSGTSDRLAALHVNAAMLGGSRLPVSISIYPLNFNSKDLITDYLDGWNDMCAEGAEYGGVTLTDADVVKYTDTVGLIIGMINTMIKMITIALVAFTALSLVVSTVMVGIITYVSVVERIKEIGILRSVGARKKDIKRLFIAETFIIGFAAGLVGIVVTYLVSVVVNLIVGSLVGIYTIAALPWWQAIIMVCVSVVLTLISGLIPAAAAAKKDPVVALRSE